MSVLRDGILLVPTYRSSLAEEILKQNVRHPYHASNAGIKALQLDCKHGMETIWLGCISATASLARCLLLLLIQKDHSMNSLETSNFKETQL